MKGCARALPRRTTCSIFDMFASVFRLPAFLFLFRRMLRVTMPIAKQSHCWSRKMGCQRWRNWSRWWRRGVKKGGVDVAFFLNTSSIALVWAPNWTVVVISSGPPERRSSCPSCKWAWPTEFLTTVNSNIECRISCLGEQALQLQPGSVQLQNSAGGLAMAVVQCHFLFAGNILWPCFRLESPSCTEPLVLSPLNAKIQVLWWCTMVHLDRSFQHQFAQLYNKLVQMSKCCVACVRQKPSIVAWSKMQQKVLFCNMFDIDASSQEQNWPETKFPCFEGHHLDVETHSPPLGLC